MVLLRGVDGMKYYDIVLNDQDMTYTWTVRKTVDNPEDYLLTKYNVALFGMNKVRFTLCDGTDLNNQTYYDPPGLTGVFNSKCAYDVINSTTSMRMLKSLAGVFSTPQVKIMMILGVMVIGIIFVAMWLG